jgi:hypothetical protein
MYQRNARFCVPRDFDYSPYFEIIKYPYIDYISDKKGYRELPWQGEFDPAHQGSLDSLKKDDAMLTALHEKKRNIEKTQMLNRALKHKKREPKTPLH